MTNSRPIPIRKLLKQQCEIKFPQGRMATEAKESPAERPVSVAEYSVRKRKLLQHRKAREV